ncbi:MAG: AAA family ATPase [Nitrospinae bacterium]|nr:AAA family ATPase [Nitrospinota bacterium]MBI3813420.1 AAA family ATPase [Nitrospinota bacterium]
MKIAISGKGGVGKTTLCAALARLYAGEGFNVLAVDADPSGHLSTALGLSVDESAKITPLIEMKELIEERTGAKPGSMGGIFKLNPFVDDLPEKLSVNIKGVRLIQTGGFRKAGSGCFCPENALLKNLLRYIFVDRDDVIILDMEAGFEHLTRGTAKSVDAMIVVVEPGLRSIKTAAAIAGLSKELGISRIFYIGNKVCSHKEREYVLKNIESSEDIIGHISYDRDIAEADLKGISPFDNSAKLVKEVRGIRDVLNKRMDIKS